MNLEGNVAGLGPSQSLALVKGWEFDKLPYLMDAVIIMNGPIGKTHILITFFSVSVH